jgi:uncharacterized protein YoxC
MQPFAQRSRAGWIGVSKWVVIVERALSIVQALSINQRPPVTDHPDSPDPAQGSADEQQLLSDSIQKFRHAMQLRSAMSIRLGKRITSIIRVGMISVSVMALAMLMLMVTLAFQMVHVVDAMENMNKHFSTMADDMKQMQLVIVKMDANMGAMPQIVDNVQEMEQSVTSMGRNMHTISDRLGVMNRNVQQLSISVASMDSTFVMMDQSVFDIGRQVNTMSSPMKTFNSMRSFTPFR